MANKTPLKANFTGSDVTSLGEFASGDTIDVSFIADDTITAAKLAAGSVDTTALGADAVDGTKIADDAVESEHIAAGAVDDAHIVGLTSSKLSGALPAIDGSALTGVATDLTSIRNDIATLALKQAVNENKAAFNLPNSFIEQFEDDSGIGTETTVDRNDSEYIRTTDIVNTYDEGDLDSSKFVNYNGTGFDAAKLIDGNTGSYWAWYRTSPANYDQGVGYNIGGDSNFGGSFAVSKFEMFSFNTAARHKNFRIYTSPDNSTWTTQDFTATGIASNVNANSGELPNSNGWFGGTLTTPVAGGYIRFMFHLIYNNGNAHAGISEARFDGPNEGITATGTLISTAQTANAAQTKVSGVILYKNEDGTATLGTDLKVYFTCNGGTNWTESTPAAAGTFSSGILMAKCPEVTCTSGTDVRYKVVWANQALASKETQLHGIAMNY